MCRPYEARRNLVLQGYDTLFDFIADYRRQNGAGANP